MPLSGVAANFRFDRETLLTLTVLVAATALPRMAVAWRRDTLCSDAVYYIERAADFERGDFTAAFGDLRLNAYVVLLAAVHAAGVPWESAGELISLACSSLVVLPLFGWARRVFCQRVATLACLLYAFHPEAIEWSGDGIRDPIFWLMSMLTLYCGWRATSMDGWGWFVAAALALTVSVLTRFDGWLLLLPLSIWLVRPWRDAPRWRVHLAVGLFVCLAAYPALLLVANVTWLRDRAEWEWGRFYHLRIVGNYVQSLVDTDATQSDAVGRQSPAVVSAVSTRQLAWGFGHTLVRGMRETYVVLLLAGAVAARRWPRGPAPFSPIVLAAATALGMWIVFWYSHETTKRYAVLVLLPLLPVAAIGLESLVALVPHQFVRFPVGSPRGALVGIAVCMFAVVGSYDALASRYHSRELRAELGRWIEREFGSGRSMFCSKNLDRLVGYYARGNHREISPAMPPDVLTATIHHEKPDLVVLWTETTSRESLRTVAASSAQLGLVRIDAARLPAGCDRVALYCRNELVAASRISR